MSSSWFQRYLLPGFAFKAFVIGGGYATGRELAEFFLPAGPRGGLLGMTLAAVIWTLAVLGIIFKTTSLGFRFHRTSVALYVAMGWLAVVAVKPLMRQLSSFELGWLVAGGLCYTLGVAFYVWKGRPYTHAIWHVFVLAGVACHLMTVLSITSG